MYHHSYDDKASTEIKNNNKASHTSFTSKIPLPKRTLKQKLSSRMSSMKEIARKTLDICERINRSDQLSSIFIEKIAKIIYSIPELAMYLFTTEVKILGKTNFQILDDFSQICYRHSNQLEAYYVIYNNFLFSINCEDPVITDQLIYISLGFLLFRNYISAERFCVIDTLLGFILQSSDQTLFFRIIHKMPNLSVHFINTLQNYISKKLIYTQCPYSSLGIKTACLILQGIASIQEESNYVSKEIFINSELSEKVDICHELDGEELKYAFSTLTYVLSLKAKKKAIQHFKFNGSIDLKLRRDNIVNDTINQLLLNKELLHKKYNVKVTFECELAQDNGGPRREFFSSFMKSVTKNNDYFLKSKTGTYYINNSSTKPSDHYLVIGYIIGLAILNNVVLPITFAEIVIGILLGIPLPEKAIEEVDPEAYSLFQSIRKNSDSLQDLDYRFVAAEMKNGEYVETPLFPGGENIVVTKSNYEYFIASYFEWRLFMSSPDSTEALQEGFNIAIGKYKQLFTPDDLTVLISGRKESDWTQFIDRLQFKGFSNQVQAWMRKLFCEWPQKKQRQFVEFVTGISAVPEDGFASLDISVELGHDEKMLPHSHTCIGQLIMPEYSSIEEMERALSISISYSEGFGII